ncbi:MAG TPA: cation-translocating P-type ATPase [Selenomonadales bacterium]|nr:cation-translocating P-type ATPase [Selenomonadales bacterium]
MKLWHSVDIDPIMTMLESDKEKGLSGPEAKQRLLQEGPNELKEKERETLLQRFISQFKDFLVLILIAASVISAFTGEFVDSAVIIAIVLMNAALGVFQEFKAEKALESLKKMAAPSAKAVREGRLTTVPAAELVKGDIVLLEAGDYVPADIRLIESMNLKVEEAALTGESVPAEKRTAPLEEDAALGDRRNMGYMSTIVTYGRGKGIVVSTGMDTEIGKIAAMLQSCPSEATPLQKKLEQFGKTLGVLCLAVCAVVFALGLFNGYRDGALDGGDIRSLLMTSISLAVAAIPEGLPSVVTIVLALGMQRMVKRNAIIKRLHAVETLGSITVICSDKTGTLTQNQMTVVKTFVSGDMLEVTGEGYQPDGTFSRDGKPVDSGAQPGLAFLLLGSALCNDARLVQDAETGSWKVAGDPTEGALLVAAAKGGYEREAAASLYPRIQEIPFDSGRKMMTTFHRGKDGKILAFVKGAPDVMLSRATAVLAGEGARLLTDADGERIRRANKEMAAQALRVLAIGYREFDALPEDISPEAVERDLIFIGLAGMIDPPRTEAREAVKVCAAAGIRPVMITGDHPETAYAIARDLGIAQDENQVMTGRNLDALSAGELKDAVTRANVFARVSPEHKVAIVEALRADNQIVAMTGDGVNDAPALKKANIGVAMGITGTDVTKETADMVVTDDNFASIVSAVEEGRVIYANIRKFVYFLLSCNTAEVFVIFFAMLLGWPIPLLPIQLLWINLVTDAFPALALGVERKEADVMKQSPRNPDEPILNKKLKLLVGAQSLAMCAVVLGAFQYGLHTYNGDLAMGRTFAFITLIASQLVCAYSARTEHQSVFSVGLFSNKYMNLAVAVSSALMLLSVYGPLSYIFKTVPPTAEQWLVLIALTPVPLLVAELLKFLTISKRNGNAAAAAKN